MQPIHKCYGGAAGESAILFDTIEEALTYTDHTVGYREVKVKLLKK